MRLRHAFAAIAALVFCSSVASANFIGFDELPTQGANGLSFNGATFGFTSADLTFNSGGGPGPVDGFIPPTLEGDAAGILTITFAQAVNHIEFDFALLSGVTLSPGVTVSFFAPGNVPAGVVNQDAISDPAGTFPTNHFVYNGAPLASISVDFNNSASRFAIDNLLFDFAPTGGAAVPLPAALWAGMGLAGWIGLKRRR